MSNQDPLDDVNPDNTSEIGEGQPPIPMSVPHRIDSARHLIAEGHFRDALSVFLSIGESLPLYSSFDKGNDPVLDAIRLAVDFETLSAKQLVVYASWVHHLTVQLLLQLKPWSSNPATASELNNKIRSFQSFVKRKQLREVETSGYFTVVETLLNQSR